MLLFLVHHANVSNKPQSLRANGKLISIHSMQFRPRPCMELLQLLIPSFSLPSVYYFCKHCITYTRIMSKSGSCETWLYYKTIAPKLIQSKTAQLGGYIPTKLLQLAHNVISKLPAGRAGSKAGHNYTFFRFIAFF